MTRQSKLLSLPLILTLAACGGGGGGSGLVSAPPPPAATQAPTFALPPTPATTSGSYQAISTVTSFDRAGTVLPLQLAPAGSVNLAVDAATRTYTLTVTAGAYQFPAGQVTLSATSALGSGQNNPGSGGSADPAFFTPAARIARGELLASTVAAGTGASGAPRVLTTFMTLFNVGHVAGWPRYLSGANWGQSYQENASGAPGAENFSRTTQTTGFLVFGQRTVPGDIPVTGRARYALESFPGQNPTLFGPYTDEEGNRYNEDGDTVLEVDFATRMLSATYDLTQSGDFYGEADGFGNSIVDGRVATAVHATGSTNFSNAGTFALALTGTGSVHVERNDRVPVPDISRSVTGNITGAFFGPQAAEVGGIWNLPTINQDGSVSTIGSSAFAGLRQAP